MITLTIILALLGFYMLYSTSNRAELTLKYKYQQWAKQNPKKSKYIGLTFLCFGLLLCIISLGFGAGIFSFIIIVMAIGSLVVLISPLRFFNRVTFIIITVLCFVIEVFFI